MNVRTPLQFLAAYGTNVGLKRTLNEDSLLAEFPVFVVADGMGGHQAGEVASEIAVNAFAPLVGRFDLQVLEVVAAVRDAQEAVSELSDSLEGGAGTTLTGVVAVNSAPGEMSWLIFNLGDSRTYRLIGDSWQRLSTDHSHVQELIENGQLTEKRALTHPSRNIITRALGDSSSEADFWISRIVPGERVVVVSDGATEGVLDREIGGAVLAPEPHVAVATVIDQALSKGGSDNITVIVVDVVQPSSEGLERFAPSEGGLPEVVAVDPDSLEILDDSAEAYLVEAADDATSPSRRR